MKKHLIIVFIFFCQLACSTESEKESVVCFLKGVHFERADNDETTFNSVREKFLNRFFTVRINLEFKGSIANSDLDKITYVINNKYYPVWFRFDKANSFELKDTSLTLYLPQLPILYLEKDLMESRESFDKRAKKVCEEMAKKSFLILRLKDDQKLKVDYSKEKTLITYTPAVYERISY